MSYPDVAVREHVCVCWPAVDECFSLLLHYLKHFWYSFSLLLLAFLLPSFQAPSSLLLHFMHISSLLPCITMRLFAPVWRLSIYIYMFWLSCAFVSAARILLPLLTFLCLCLLMFACLPFSSSCSGYYENLLCFGTIV